ncbi:MAG: tetraacyldisaccharide 4'-kinase [Phycisphaerales bacterium]|nr:tetraacyldisaccharide 4'-kinase [Phycisphaerales bacterium]
MKSVLSPISVAYGLVVDARNARYDSGRGVIDVGCPVISIGNITAGGTGKTPMVRWFAEELIALGRQPAIALRGYGRGTGASDEAMEHEASLPEVSVLANPNRTAAIIQHRAMHPECDVIVLDDGFQHRKVARSMDVVLIDGRRDLEKESLLPHGRLREPLSSLRRATEVIVTHAEKIDSQLAEVIHRYHGQEPVAWCNHVWTGLTRHDSEGVEDVPVDSIAGLRLVTHLGVAQPAGIIRQIESVGGVVTHQCRARDHAKVTPRTILEVERAAKDADAIFVTGKDWVKFRGLIEWGTLGKPVFVPQLSMDLINGSEELKQRLLGVLERP